MYILFMFAHVCVCVRMYADMYARMYAHMYGRMSLHVANILINISINHGKPAIVWGTANHTPSN